MDHFATSNNTFPTTGHGQSAPTSRESAYPQNRSAWPGHQIVMDFHTAAVPAVSPGQAITSNLAGRASLAGPSLTANLIPAGR